LAVHISKAGVALVPGMGEGGMDSLTDELHGAGAKPLKGFKGKRPERVARAVMLKKNLN
jgi:hypothetical protein